MKDSFPRKFIKRTFFLTFAIFLSTWAAVGARPDSLLTVLDATIADRAVYTESKRATIEDLKRHKNRLHSLDERYRINSEIIANYESFVCDSAEYYIHENIRLARELGNDTYLTDSRLKLAFIYSISGLFVQAIDLFRSFDYEALLNYQKICYCWNHIRYYENLIKYTDDSKLSVVYLGEIDALRDNLLSMLPEESDAYLKEKAFKFQAQGRFAEALDILTAVHNSQEPASHGYAMSAMSLAKVYRMTGDRELENRFLKLAAITDVRFAVKENEALLALAMNLFEEGDITRSYSYISAALSDANFYNSRFRNTVIARVQPVVESNYLYRIEKQKRNLIGYAFLASFFLVALVVTLSVLIRQMNVVSRARRGLRDMNHQLVALNQKLGEANIVKEKYIGHFMNQCALYINKLDTYRKDVNHKIKNGQIDRLYKPSDKELEREMEELYRNFDEAFLKLYPDFVDQFNSLLEPAGRYEIEGNRLNTELRIFALIRLGVTNVNQIAEFLRCSLQTIYNYKSKVKNKARKEAGNFEDAVRKLGLTVSQSDSI